MIAFQLLTDRYFYDLTLAMASGFASNQFSRAQIRFCRRGLATGRASLPHSSAEHSPAGSVRFWLRLASPVQGGEGPLLGLAWARPRASARVPIMGARALHRD